eukprot:symbB.v1.2.031725.t1/scaffold3703.1/size65852/4
MISSTISYTDLPAMAATSYGSHGKCAFVVPHVLPPKLCRELWFQHLTCAVPGYRSGCTASCFAGSSPCWAYPAWVRARQLARDAAEEILDDFGGLFPETTVTVGWYPGSGLPVHRDDCQDYLQKRHVTVVIWLNEGEVDFEGGEFFFDSEEKAFRPQAGHAAIFTADVPHGLKAVKGGLRVSLNVWFTRDPEASEDLRVLQHPPPGPGLPLPQRLFGQGPQALWPPNATTLARQTLTSMALPWRGGPFRWKQRKTGGWLKALGVAPSENENNSDSFKTSQRLGLMKAAFHRLLGETKPKCRCLLLLLLFLALDGITSPMQEKLFKEYGVSKYNQIMWVNLSSAIVSIITLLSTGSLVTAISFCTKHPALLGDAMTLSVAQVSSQWFIYSQVKEFGAVVFAATMNVRQLFSIVTSYVEYGHYITGLQVVSLCLVFGALFFKSYDGLMATSNREREPLVPKTGSGTPPEVKNSEANAAALPKEVKP